MSFGDEADVDYTTAKGRDWPSVRQFNVFLANRMGALLDLVRRFEQTDVRVVSLTVVETADCAIVRMVLSDPERALEIFQQAEVPVTESDLLVVQLPEGKQPLIQICKALLMAERLDLVDVSQKVQELGERLTLEQSGGSVDVARAEITKARLDVQVPWPRRSM